MRPNNELEYFPAIKDDELLYSAASRYYLVGGGISHEKTTLELTGVRSCHFSRFFPCHLQFFCDRLPGKVRVSPETLIEKYTLYPLFRPFVTKERHEKIMQEMIANPKGGQIHSRIGISSYRLPSMEYLKCCPDCIDQDKKNYGFAYWHRSHQVAGVCLCHQHKEILQNTQVRVRQGSQFTGYYPLEKGLISGTAISSRLSQSDKDHLQWISEQVHWLLVNKIESIGPQGVQERFKSLLRDRGLLTLKDQVRQNEFEDKFKVFFSENLLNLLNCQMVPTRHGHLWVSEQLRAKEKSTHPLFYLLILRCLGTDFEGFFSYKPNPFLPFGEPLWPCLNKLSDHYREPLIDDHKMVEEKQDGKLVGKFYCICGFSYSRLGPDNCKEDRYRYDRVIRYGKVWNSEIFRLYQNGMEPVEFEKEFGISNSTIHRRLKLIEKNPDKELNTNWREDRKRERSEVWVQAVKDNPKLSRGELRKKYKYLVAWLERNAPETVKECMPERMIPGGSSRSRRNWVERDEHLTSKVEEIVKQIMDRYPSVRASKQLICEVIGARTYLGNLDKLPKLLSALDMFEETVKKYQIRRVDVEAEILQKEGRLMRSELIKRAGVSKVSNEPHVKKAIERHLAGESCSHT